MIDFTTIDYLKNGNERQKRAYEVLTKFLILEQNKPTIEQNAYRHMIAEYKILEEKGEDFKQKIVKLKKEGMKTESAFGMLLNLENPYEDLLKL
ncbi:DUF4269 domain-containing protein [Chryseobacterium fistulae]|uniref:DUF4269 domain-containing protein n=1 Tax=Chryseobacterium fistulae TaxID=2675058 RepID=A0A6N4XTH8_9FLAO|nr:DUF4269 domain-containing protein [Chryseobacterium fistulae]CAA7391075.1 hypothetical protein CHRY9393_02842 [Chryseobacterium fistulae]